MSTRASLESQLNNIPCEAEDTEEMFWLRESDDYQSKVKLGNLLAAQYRFKDACEAYEAAASVKATDSMLFICLGGSYLSLYKYEQAKAAYDKAAALGAPVQSVSYPLGVLYYLKGEYAQSAETFAKCLPCGGELKIAVIYWHTLASYRAGIETTLLNEFTEDMEVGHHIAYKEAVMIFSGLKSYVSPTDEGAYTPGNPLDQAVFKYGVSVYCEHINDTKNQGLLLEETLQCNAVWPSVSYLAAYNDNNNK